MFLHFLLSSILCNISEFIQFCFFGCISFPQISSATVEIPSFNLFQISSTSIHPSIFSILYAFLTSDFLRLFTFHLIVFLAFFTLCSLIFIFTTTGLRSEPHSAAGIDLLFCILFLILYPSEQSLSDFLLLRLVISMYAVPTSSVGTRCLLQISYV